MLLGIFFNTLMQPVVIPAERKKDTLGFVGHGDRLGPAPAENKHRKNPVQIFQFCTGF